MGSNPTATAMPFTCGNAGRPESGRLAFPCLSHRPAGRRGCPVLVLWVQRRARPDGALGRPPRGPIPGCPNQAEATDLITAALAETGVRATLTRTVIESQEEAQRRGFVGSPTFLLAGLDPFARPGAPAALACRLYATGGRAAQPSIHPGPQAGDQARGRRDAGPRHRLTGTAPTAGRTVGRCAAFS